MISPNQRPLTQFSSREVDEIDDSIEKLDNERDKASLLIKNKLNKSNSSLLNPSFSPIFTSFSLKVGNSRFEGRVYLRSL